eukprot:m.69755 g.69755  ORF g.69755 m.69755 type:complete len:442 (+) comp12086_c0_seq6:1390-2715(+)
MEKDEDLYERFPGREKEIDILACIVSGLPPPSLFVYGCATTGKSTVVPAVLQEYDCLYTTVRCIEAYDVRSLLRKILFGLASALNVPENAEFLKYDSVNEFVQSLNKMLGDKQAQHAYETAYIVLDEAERLREYPPSILPVMLRLFELVDHHVCPVLISNLTWEKFRSNTGVPEPLTVLFPPYEKDTILRIIQKDCRPNEDRQLFSQFARIVYDVFSGPCRDLNELRHLVSLLFPLYMEPIELGKLSKTDFKELYRCVLPELKKQLGRIYLREVSTSEWEQHAGDRTEKAPKAHKTQELELPFLSKYMLVAAYLASYNPESTDARIFSKHKIQKKRKAPNKKKKVSKAAVKVPQRLLGPRAFSMERLLAIFYSIFDGEKPKASAELYALVASLVTLQLLTYTSKNLNLDSPMLKCLCSFEAVQRISLALDIDLGKFLYEVT